MRAAVRQFSLGERPDPFIGIQFRSIGRKMLEVEAGVMIEEFLEWFALMSGGVVQQNDDRATEMSQQLPQKPTNLLLPILSK
jgi:hypothetical protein